MGGYYRGYNPRDRIAELLLRQGDIEADRALRSGQIIGGTLGSLGQITAGAIEQDMAQKAHAQRLALDEFRYGQQAEREASREAREAARDKREVEKEAKAEEDRRRLEAAIAAARGGAQPAAPPTAAPTGAVPGAPTAAPGDPSGGIDYDAIEQSLPPHQRNQFRESVNKANEAAMKFRQGQDDYMARLALGVLPWIDDPEKAAGAVELALTHAERNGIQGVQEFRERIKADPTSLPKIIQEIVSRSPSAAAEMRAREPKKHMVRVPGPGGTEVQRLATEDELEKGIQTYREPKAAPAPVRIETIENGKKVTKFVTPTAGTSYPTAEDTEKPLSGEAAKVYSVATTVIPEIEQLKKAFEKDYGSSVRGVVSGTDRRLVRLVDQIADKVGRLRSGGAINKDEEERFKRQLGTTIMDAAFGRPEDAIAALDAVISEANSIVSNVRPGAPRGPLRLGQPAPPLGRFERAGGGSGRYERVD